MNRSQPRATIALVAINVLAYVWEMATGATATMASLVAHGALYGPYVTIDGQWWRVVTSAFLHGNLPHIALNMFALYQLGSFVESMLGSWRMLGIYTVAMFGGGIAIVYFAPMDVTVGASGAIFGLFGALLAIGLRMGSRGRWLITQTVPILIINLVFTFAVPYISKAGHIGGLVSGFVAGLALYVMRRASDPVVVDTQTGETTQAEYLAPGEPNGPPSVTGIP